MAEDRKHTQTEGTSSSDSEPAKVVSRKKHSEYRVVTKNSSRSSSESSRDDLSILDGSQRRETHRWLCCLFSIQRSTELVGSSTRRDLDQAVRM